MAQFLRLASGVDRSLAHRAFAERWNAQRRRATPPPTDQVLARISWVNALIVGGEDEVAKFITSLWPCLFTPIVVRQRGEPLRLTPTSAPAGTIVIYDVETLTLDEQHALNQWLAAGNGARVVSSTSQSLMPLLAGGTFDDELYYRLNVVTIDLKAPVAP